MSSSLLHHIQSVAATLGIKNLKPEQEQAIRKFVEGTDVFVALLTGYRKSLCYIALPLVFDRLRGVHSQSIVLVVSPLIALMKDQIAHCTSWGLKAGFIGSDTSDSRKKAILEGKCQIVYICPESLFTGQRWTEMLREEPYLSNLVGFVVDEAHCQEVVSSDTRSGQSIIHKFCTLCRGETFRTEFSHLGEIRSVLLSNVHVMALTATAMTSLHQSVTQTLAMQNTLLIEVSPDKANMKYNVSEYFFTPLITNLAQQKFKFRRMIIFCSTLNECSNL